MPESTNHIERANSLISLASALSVTGIDKLGEQFPALGALIKDERDFCFLMTIAGVGVAVGFIGEDVSKREVDEFSRAVGERLMKWDFMGHNPYGEGGAYKAYADLAGLLRTIRSLTIRVITAQLSVFG